MSIAGVAGRSCCVWPVELSLIGAGRVGHDEL